jgi:hypothetical protein
LVKRKAMKVWVVFESGKGFGDRAIQWFTRSPVNHVAFEYESMDWDARWTAEAATKGVRAVPSRTRTWSHRFLVKYDVVDSLRKTSEYIGEKYDYTGLLVFGFFILAWRWFKVKLRKPLYKTKGLFCSEFVCHALKDKLPELPEAQWTTPQDILTACSNHPDLFEKELV